MEKKVGKEVKIGLAVIGVLITSFGYVLVRRLAHESQAAAATASATPDHGSDAEKAKGRSEGSEKPTLLAGLESGRPAELTPEQKSSSGSPCAILTGASWRTPAPRPGQQRRRFVHAPGSSAGRRTCEE